MKKYIIVLLYLLCSFNLFGQEIESIQIKSPSLYNQMFDISDIDSIKYDYFKQLQYIYTKDSLYSLCLSDITKVDFSQQKAVNAYVTNKYIDNTVSYIFSGGEVLSVMTDSLNGHLLSIDFLNFKNREWSKGDSIGIYCDSLFRPLIATNKDFYYRFFYHPGNTCDVNVTDRLTGKSFTHKNFNVSHKVSHKSTREKTFGFLTLGGALDMYSGIDFLYNPSYGSAASNIVSWLNSLLLPDGVSKDAIS